MNNITESRELEMIVISLLIKEESEIDSALAILNEDHFYFPVHKSIISTIKASGKVSHTLIENALVKDGHPTPTSETIKYIRISDDYMPTDLGHYVERLIEKYKKTESEKLVEFINESEDMDEVRAMIELTQEKLNTSVVVDKVKNFGELLPLLQEEEKSKAPCGYPSLDEMLKGGFEKGRLYVVAARPGVGKTTMLENIAFKFANRENKTCFITLEMTMGQVVKDITRKACAGKSTVTYDHGELIQRDVYKT